MLALLAVALAVVGLSGKLANDVVEHSKSPDGVPLSFDGVSPWPNLFLLWVMAVISAIMTWKAWRGISHVDRNLELKYGLDRPGPDSLAQWWQRTGTAVSDLAQRLYGNVPSQRKTDVQSLYREYQDRGRLLTRLGRAILMALSFFGAILCAKAILGEWSPPARELDGFEKFVQGFSAIVLLTFGFFVLDAIQLAVSFVHVLTSEPPSWPEESFRKAGRPGKLARDERSVELVADLTTPLRTVSIYPLLIFLVVVLRLLPWFGGHGRFSPTAALAAAVLFLMVLGGVVLLRGAASRARRDVLQRMQIGLEGSLAHAEQRDKGYHELYRVAIAKLHEEQRGAFLPILQDPFLQFLAVPFGGVGGLLLIEYAAQNL